MWEGSSNLILSGLIITILTIFFSSVTGYCNFSLESKYAFICLCMFISQMCLYTHDCNVKTLTTFSVYIGIYISPCMFPFSELDYLILFRDILILYHIRLIYGWLSCNMYLHTSSFQNSITEHYSFLPIAAWFTVSLFLRLVFDNRLFSPTTLKVRKKSFI